MPYETIHHSALVFNVHGDLVTLASKRGPADERCQDLGFVLHDQLVPRDDALDRLGVELLKILKNISLSLLV